jgi:hypothetical protein
MEDRQRPFLAFAEGVGYCSVSLGATFCRGDPCDRPPVEVVSA